MYESACKPICGKRASVVLDTPRMTPKSGRGIDVNASITNNSLGPQSLHHSVSVWFPSTCSSLFCRLCPPISFPISLSVCCCVPPGYRVPRPPSPLLSLWPCHLQLLHGTRHTATGKEREERGHHIHTQREKKGWGPRDEALCMSGERQRGKERGQVWKVVRKDVREDEGTRNNEIRRWQSWRRYK